MTKNKTANAPVSKSDEINVQAAADVTETAIAQMDEIVKTSAVRSALGSTKAKKVGLALAILGLVVSIAHQFLKPKVEKPVEDAATDSTPAVQ